jgi:hypothetical protein
MGKADDSCEKVDLVFNFDNLENIWEYINAKLIEVEMDALCINMYSPCLSLMSQ